MSTVVNAPETVRKHRPYVPETMEMKEFEFRAVLIGLVMTAILGSANAYLGLRAGMTIAATYPAAVIGMALLRLMKGSLLEENIARTVGSIGESVAAGAVFTIPAFVMAGLWPGLTRDQYWKSVALMVIGGTLGILFVTLLRRVMVEDPDLPYPESVAASEIHKAGQQGATAAKILFANMGFGGFMYLLGAINVFNPNNTFHIRISELGKKLLLRTGTNPNVATTITGGSTLFGAPDISPAYLGVGYIIGPRLGALNFAGGLLAWGLLVPLLTFTIGPYIQAAQPAGQTLSWDLLAGAIYYSIVRPIAVGGMLVGASYTLFKMRKQLAVGMGRAVSDLKKSAAVQAATNRTERDLNAKIVFAGVALVFVAMVVLYHYFISGAGNLSAGKILAASLVAAGVMIVVGFFFAAVSGNLVGMSAIVDANVVATERVANQDVGRLLTCGGKECMQFPGNLTAGSGADARELCDVRLHGFPPVRGHAQAGIQNHRGRAVPGAIQIEREIAEFPAEPNRVSLLRKPSRVGMLLNRVVSKARSREQYNQCDHADHRPL